MVDSHVGEDISEISFQESDGTVRKLTWNASLEQYVPDAEWTAKLEKIETLTNDLEIQKKLTDQAYMRGSRNHDSIRASLLGASIKIQELERQLNKNII